MHSPNRQLLNICAISQSRHWITIMKRTKSHCHAAKILVVRDGQKNEQVNACISNSDNIY